MEITSTVVGPLATNAYLLTDAGEGLLVDAADDALALLALIGDTPIGTLVTTHRHGDHVQALAAIASHTGARVVAGVPDAAAIESATGVMVDDRVWDGDHVHVGNVRLEVIGLVGHTPGSIALAWTPEHGAAQMFVGDSLFPGGPGKTTRPEDFHSLMTDLETKIFGRFGDDTVVHPGHGDPTTLGRERASLPQWWARGW